MHTNPSSTNSNFYTPNEKIFTTPPSKANNHHISISQTHGTLRISEFDIDGQRLHHSSQTVSYAEQDEMCDRFIPLRKNQSPDQVSCFIAYEENYDGLKGKEIQEEKVSVDQMYRYVLLNKNTQNLLKFRGDQDVKNHLNLSDQIYQNCEPRYLKQEKHFIQSKIKRRLLDPQYRKISKVPFKVLDAPNLQDDFYLNLLEWSSQNVLSVALDSSLYFWNANTNQVSKFCQKKPDSITSLAWNSQGSQIAIGTSKGTVQVWDAGKNCKLNECSGHSERVSSLSWGDGVIASGSKDRSIQVRDPRQHSGHIVSTFQGHSQEVCGLKWSFDGSLLASGGNDNKLLIWSPKSPHPICKFTSHRAAVKAIAWSPHNYGVLASGGGTADKTIKFWSTLDSCQMDSIDTGSQVCSLVFSKNTKEIVSTHGYSNNEIIIWKYPSLQKMSTLTGHTSRVLFLAISPCGDTIVTGAGDETLRFWSVFPCATKTTDSSQVVCSMDLR